MSISRVAEIVAAISSSAEAIDDRLKGSEGHRREVGKLPGRVLI